MIRYANIFITGLQLSAALLVVAPALGAAPALGTSAIPTVATAAAQQGSAPEPAPRAEAPVNATVIYTNRVLSEDTFWRGEVLVQGALTVAPQATLSIEPGTVVRFRRAGTQAPLLMVQGRIVAAGTRETPIVFTSSFTVPAAADWQGVMLVGTEKKNILENCRIEGAQTGLDAIFSTVTLKNVRSHRSGTGMRFQDSLVSMEEGGVSDCDTGLAFTESEATLRNVTVENNRLGVVAKRSSIYLVAAQLSGNQAGAFTADSCRLKIQGGSAVGNGSGVTVLGCEGSVSGVKLVNNKEYGLSLTASRLRVSGNQISGNGNNGLIAFDGSAVAWDNAIYENAGYDLYNAGVETFRAPGNWWGALGPKVFDNSGRGDVLVAPLLEAMPPVQQSQ